MKQKILIIIGVVIIFVVSLGYFYSQRSQPSKPMELGDVVITLERTVCFGRCPVYTLTIYGDGRVVYNGKQFVGAIGVREGQISRDDVKDLVDAFYGAGYFELKDTYDAKIIDVPTTITSITIGGKTKKVVDRYEAPKRLKDLEHTIDAIAHSERWIKVENENASTHKQ